MSTPQEAAAIGEAFVGHYYQTLNTNPAGLATLYQPGSAMTKEGTRYDGPEAIVANHSQTPLQHNIPQLSKDVQVTSSGNLLIMVTGQLQIVGQGNPLLFSQTFELVAIAPGNYYIHNEIMRLIYA